MQETNNILAILDNYLHDNPDEIAKEMANDFRKRRIEKNLTREQVADKSGVAVSNICKWDWPSDFREYDCRWHKE